MTTNDKALDAKIGQAWKAHYDGQDQNAVEQLLKIAEEAPDNVDVYWGLGLAYRDLGETQKALDAFGKVVELIDALIESEHGQLGRFFMLNRMATQQIERLSSTG